MNFILIHLCIVKEFLYDETVVLSMLCCLLCFRAMLSMPCCLLCSLMRVRHGYDVPIECLLA